LYQLRKIHLTQFRNFTTSQYEFNSNTVAFTGLNGIGKTNLLDAIYYLCFTKSYFQSRDINNAQHNTEGFRINGTFQNNDLQENINCVWKQGKKQLNFNNTPYDKISEHIGKYAAVMIAPDDTEILLGGGEFRRKFFDGILSLLDANYLNNLLQYNKYIQQKNAYLKLQQKSIDYSLLNIYNTNIAQLGSYIIESRAHLTQQIPQLLQYFYSQLTSNANEIPNIIYSKHEDSNKLYQQLELNQQKEIEAKRCLIGPHLDDWTCTINESNCKLHASQGQKKSFLIALKLTQLELLKSKHPNPILLLDDIFEKLDAVRLNKLFSLLKQNNYSQIFMTHTSSEDIKKVCHQIYDDIQIIQLH
jgi:DNA replication and repair protein RecF